MASEDPDPATAVVKRVGALLLLVASGVGLCVAAHEMRAPVVEAPEQPGFVAVSSPQSGGSLWLDISSAELIDVTSGTSVSLEIEVSSDQDVVATILVGGRRADGLRACTGEGVYFDSADALTGADLAAGDPARALLERYVARRPATGRLTGVTGQDALAATSAARALDGTTVLRSDVHLASAEPRVWRPDLEEQEAAYEVRSARATCTFDPGAFIASSGELHEFRSPDLVAGTAEQAGAGPVQTSAHVELANDGFRMPVNTFPDVVDRVDETTHVRVLTLEADWWSRSGTGPQSIVLTGGALWLEPDGAVDRRTYARVAAGLCASVLVATAIALVRSLASGWSAVRE